MAFRTSPAVLQAFLSHLGFGVGAVLIAVLAVVLAALARIGGLSRRNFDEHLD